MKYPVAISNYQLVRNAADNCAEIYIDGEIVDADTQQFYKDYFGDETSVSYRSFRNELLACGFKNVHVFCNGPGGHVGDAMAIHDLIKDLNTHKGWNINTYGRGIVASSLTYVVMAGKNGGEVSKNTSWLIHDVSGAIRGKITEIENYARMMRKFNDLIVNLYSDATGKSKSTISAMMAAETWIMGKDIQNMGFVKSCNGTDCKITNTLSPEQWPYSNRTVLNKYNSFITNTHNFLNMDFKKLAETMANSLKAAFGNKDLSNEQRDTAITDAISKGFADIDTAIDNRIKLAMNSQATATAIGNAIAKGFEQVPANFQKAITDATEALATKEELEDIKSDLADKLGGQNSRSRGKANEPGNEAEDIAELDGWKWGE